MRLEKGAEKVAEELKKCMVCFLSVTSDETNYVVKFIIDSFLHADDPNSDPNIAGDPYKTLFVAKLVS